MGKQPLAFYVDLTFPALWANSAYDKLIQVFLLLSLLFYFSRKKEFDN